MNRTTSRGRLLAMFRRGEFRGHLHHYPERVDLTLEDDFNGRMYLTGSWTHLNDECLHTARVVAQMAIGPAHWEETAAATGGRGGGRYEATMALAST